MDTTNTPGQLQSVMDIFVEWCTCNYFDVNSSKTKEVVVDFCNNPTIITTLSVNNHLKERVESYRYLGTIVDQRLTFQPNSESIFFKCHQCLYFLGKLWRLQLHLSVLTAVYKCLIESVINISAWFCLLSNIHRNPLNKIITMCSNTIGLEQESRINIYSRRVKLRGACIASYITHSLTAQPLQSATVRPEIQITCIQG